MNFERWLSRWRDAGLLDEAALERIRAFEDSQRDSQSLTGPVRLMLALGGLAIAAGVLLFVAAHWDTMSPASRFMLVLTLVAGFHLAGASLQTRFPALSTTLHAVGTACLGAGIFLAAQIFHLAEHWPGGIMLWTIGAWAGWWLLRDLPHLAWIAVLTPAWLLSEWAVAAEGYVHGALVPELGVFLLAFAYMASRRPLLSGLGNWVLLIAAANLAFSARVVWGYADDSQWPSTTMLVAGWLLAIGGPGVIIALFARPLLAWYGAAVAWALSLFLLGRHFDALEPLFFLWLAIGAGGLMSLGLKSAERWWINLGVAGFALTVLAFYFSSVFDKLGRATSLLTLGVLLIAGGWALERMRRNLLARMEGGA